MKESMILFEQESLFVKNVVEPRKFSNDEIEYILNHSKFSKMFDVMELNTSYYKFKNSYESVISNIIYQQVAFKVARKSEIKLFAHFNYELDPNVLITLTKKQYKEFGITGRRVDYIINFSNYVLENSKFWNDIETYSDELITKELIKIKGIGLWTIEMFLLFGLGRKDIISLGDLIIVNGLKFLYGDCSSEELKTIIKECSNYGTIISMHIWKFMEQGYYKQLSKVV